MHHYVPQFILRNFSFGKNQLINAFDKWGNRSFKSNISKIAGETYFYNWSDVDGLHSLEASLSKLETAAAPIFKKVLDADSAGCLSQQEKTVLSSFFAVQFTRTKAVRENIEDLKAQFGQKMQLMFGEHEISNEFAEFIEIDNENQKKKNFAEILLDAEQSYAPHFFDKTWFLVRTTADKPFFIGDNPIALQNYQPSRGPWSMLGLAVKGIEIYFPLSATRAIAMFCPSLAHAAFKARSQVYMLTAMAPHQLDRLALDTEGVVSFANALEFGGPYDFSKENVINFNSLQVSFSERYVFSMTPKFDLVTEMLSANQKYSRGPRGTVG